MVGVTLSVIQPNGITTDWATIIDIRWQPGLSANVQIGFFVSESDFSPGAIPIWTEYFPIDVTQINPAAAIPGQLITQLMASGAPLYGGTLTS